MSIERCEICERQIDTDFEDDCYVEVPWLNLEDHVWCAQCQDREWRKHEAGNDERNLIDWQADEGKP